jgi:hypothetical protein
MTRQEMMQHCDDPRSGHILSEAYKRDAAKASKHVRAALAELAQIGPAGVGIGRRIMEAETFLRATLDEIEAL